LKERRRRRDRSAAIGRRSKKLRSSNAYSRTIVASPAVILGQICRRTPDCRPGRTGFDRWNLRSSRTGFARPVTPGTSVRSGCRYSYAKDKHRVATMMTIPSATACVKMVLTFAAVSAAGYSLLPLIGY
jgi:hypothetical protein